MNSNMLLVFKKREMNSKFCFLLLCWEKSLKCSPLHREGAAAKQNPVPLWQRSQGLGEEQHGELMEKEALKAARRKGQRRPSRPARLSAQRSPETLGGGRRLHTDCSGILVGFQGANPHHHHHHHSMKAPPPMISFIAAAAAFST